MVWKELRIKKPCRGLPENEGSLQYNVVEWGGTWKQSISCKITIPVKFFQWLTLQIPKHYIGNYYK